MSPIDRILKNDASKSELFEDVLLLETLVILAAMKRSQRWNRRRHVLASNYFRGSKKPCNRMRLQGLNVLTVLIARLNPHALRRAGCASWATFYAWNRTLHAVAITLMGEVR